MAAGERSGAKRWHLSTPAIAGLIGAVSATVALVFTLSPSLKPDPGERINATLAVVSIEPLDRYVAFLGRVGVRPRPKDRGRVPAMSCT